MYPQYSDPQFLSAFFCRLVFRLSVYLYGCFSLFLSVHMVRLSGFCPLVCPSFRLSGDRPAIGPPVCLAVGLSGFYRSVAWTDWQSASLCRCLPGGRSGFWPAACRSALSWSIVLSVCLSVGLSVCLSGGAWLPVGWSVCLSLTPGLSFCPSARRRSAGSSLCRLVAWRSDGRLSVSLSVCWSVPRFF